MALAKMMCVSVGISSFALWASNHRRRLYPDSDKGVIAGDIMRHAHLIPRVHGDLGIDLSAFSFELKGNLSAGDGTSLTIHPHVSHVCLGKVFALSCRSRHFVQPERWAKSRIALDAVYLPICLMEYLISKQICHLNFNKWRRIASQFVIHSEK